MMAKFLSNWFTADILESSQIRVTFVVQAFFLPKSF